MRRPLRRRLLRACVCPPFVPALTSPLVFIGGGPVSACPRRQHYQGSTARLGVTWFRSGLSAPFAPALAGGV
eukprot:4994641-Alexandrium_andersonii.AAC.1